MANGGSNTAVTGAVSPSSPGLPVTTTLAPGVIGVHLKLFFWEPGKTVRRPFPKGVNVRVKGKPYTVGEDGYFVLPAEKKILGKWSFTLEFPSTNPQYVVCEPMPASPPAGSPPSGSPPKYPLLASNPPDTGERYFLLPMDNSQGHWQLRNSDWEMTRPDNVKYDAGKGMLEHQDKKKPIGSATAPVELTLDPHWKFFQFEFFDRYYGHTDHGDKRVTTPPLPLAGFYNDKAASGAQADTRSNWTVPDGQKLVQCLPFIRRRDNSGKSLITALDNSHLGLRFQFSEARYAFSESATSRKMAVVPKGDDRLKPGPDRLKYYDLPPVWKSRRYFTRWAGAPAPGGKFFNELPKAQIDGADTQANALRFCLDDIVLFEADGANLKPLATWAASDRVAVFNHRFNDTVGATPTKNGVYKVADPVGDATKVYPLPFSKVDVTRSPSSSPKNTYIFDYPDWTRLIATQGSLFDVFDRRAPDHADSERAVGARAAVRWIDATAPLSGVVTLDWGWVTPPFGAVAGVAGWITAAGPHNPVGGARLSSAGAIEKQPAADSLFALQSCHYQNCTEFPNKYDEAKTTRFGRFDMLLLRCCDVKDGEEVATNLHYIRTYYHDLAAKVSATASVQRQWCHDISVNVSGRWNGDDAINDCRAVMVPDQSPAAPLRVQVVWFDQSLEKTCAAWQLNMTAAGAGRSNRGSADGTGETASDQQDTEGTSGWFTSAHESGHMNGFPDDYNERWDCASYDQLSFRANGPPGDPYEPDGRQDANMTYGGTVLNGSMMNVNSRVRARYYWPSTEWVSRIIGFPLKVKFTDTLDAAEYEYKLPPHPKRNEDRTYLSWPYIGKRDATTGAAAPATSPPSPGVVNWDKFEYYLYTLGKDHYSQEGLQQLAVAARSDRGLAALATLPTFDGMLVIDVRLKCTLPDDATVGTEDTNRADLVAKIAAAVRKGMCNRWSMKGSFGSPPHSFDRCLIHITALVMVENDPHGHYGAKNWNTAALETEYGVHFALEAKESTASPPVAASIWDIPNRKLTVDFRPGQSVDLGTQLEDKFPRFLGIDKTMADVTANDVKKIVDLLGGSGVTVEEMS